MNDAEILTAIEGFEAAAYLSGSAEPSERMTRGVALEDRRKRLVSAIQSARVEALTHAWRCIDSEIDEAERVVDELAAIPARGHSPHHAGIIDGLRLAQIRVEGVRALYREVGHEPG